MDILKYIALGLYIGLIIIVGLKGRSKTTSSKDLLFGGGKIGGFMSAFSYGTAYFSAVLFIGFAGQIGWNFGLSGIWIALFNAFIGVFGVWKIIGWKLKSASIDLNVHTLGEYFNKRYASKSLRIISTISIFIFLIPYSSAVFMGLSYLFTTNFEIPYWIALIIIGCLTAFYLAMGGYKSVAMVDVIFGIIMIVGVFILLFTTLSEAGGLSVIINDLEAVNPELTALVGPPGFWNLITLIFLTSIAPFAMPQLLQKFVSIKDRKAINKGSIASTIFALIIGGIAYFVGSTTRIFLNSTNNPNVFENGTPIYDRLMPEILQTVVPNILSSLMLLLILAASMSSLASMVLTSSSTFAKDLYNEYLQKDASDTQIRRISKISNIVFVLLAILLALANIDSIVVIMGISWGAFRSVFLGPVIWGLYGNPKTFTKIGAIFASFWGFNCLYLFISAWKTLAEAGTIGMMTSFILPPVIALISKIIALILKKTR